MFLVGHLLQLDQRGEGFATDSEGPEDRHRLGYRLPDLIDGTQFDVYGGQVQGDHGHLVGKTPVQEALASTQQRPLCGTRMTELAEELAFLPGSSQEDQSILELFVEVPGLEVERERLLGTIEVDIAANQVMAGGEQ